mgnify:CR=1 FL=1
MDTNDNLGLGWQLMRVWRSRIRKAGVGPCAMACVALRCVTLRHGKRDRYKDGVSPDTDTDGKDGALRN